MANAGYFAAPERRRRILDSARRVFAARGYHATNISHICEDLGIARGTLYLHFKSKKEVFAAIVEDLLDRVRGAVDSSPAPEIPSGLSPTRAQIVRYSARSIERTLAAAFADETSLRILVREAVGLDVHIDAILRAIDDIVIGKFAEHLGVAQRLGVIRPDADPRAAALFVLGGIQKLALDALAREGRIDLARLANEAARLQMTGLLSDEVKP